MALKDSHSAGFMRCSALGPKFGGAPFLMVQELNDLF